MSDARSSRSRGTKRLRVPAGAHNRDKRREEPLPGHNAPTVRKRPHQSSRDTEIQKRKPKQPTDTAHTNYRANKRNHRATKRARSQRRSPECNKSQRSRQTNGTPQQTKVPTQDDTKSCKKHRNHRKRVTSRKRTRVAHTQHPSTEPQDRHNPHATKEPVLPRGLRRRKSTPTHCFDKSQRETSARGQDTNERGRPQHTAQQKCEPRMVQQHCQTERKAADSKPTRKLSSRQNKE